MHRLTRATRAKKSTATRDARNVQLQSESERRLKTMLKTILATILAALNINAATNQYSVPAVVYSVTDSTYTFEVSDGSLWAYNAAEGENIPYNGIVILTMDNNGTVSNLDDSIVGIITVGTID